MNRIYRVVFNASRGVVQVAPECAAAGHKKARGRRSTGRVRGQGRAAPAVTPIAAALVLAIAAPAFVATPACASPFPLTSATGTAGGAGTGGGYGSQGTGGTGAKANNGGKGGVSSHNAGYAGGPGGAGFGAGGVGGWYNRSGLDGGGGGGGGGSATNLYSASYSMALGVYRTGGKGGAGGSASNGSYGGYGGVGGDGVYGVSFTLSTAGSIAGGYGGEGLSYASGGAGGRGVAGSGFTLSNSGTISGGHGGQTSLGGFANYVATGGVAVLSTGSSSISNSGHIYGGLGGYAAMGKAIDLSGGGNTLTLLYGSTLIGNVVSSSGTTGGGDVLELGGGANATLSGTFSGTAPTSWSGTVVFSGFQLLRKSGTSTWTITTTTGSTANGIPNWDVEAGVLQLAGSDNYNPSSTDGLRIAVAPAGSTVATPGVNNGEINTLGSANLNGATLSVNVGIGSYLAGTKYDLVHAAGGISGTFGSVLYNATFGTGLTPKISYTATDVYLTVASASSGSSGGGGAFGPWTLLGLAGLAGIGCKRNRVRS